MIEGDEALQPPVLGSNRLLAALFSTSRGTGDNGIDMQCPSKWLELLRPSLRYPKIGYSSRQMILKVPMRGLNKTDCPAQSATMASNRLLTRTPLNDGRTLNELFQASRLYHISREYVELLEYISKFRDYAPFNGLLMHIQNPDLSYVASNNDWIVRFNRRPKHNARPVVILKPFGPVMFLYDLADTEGEPLPAAFMKPFDTEGALDVGVFWNTVSNCSLHGIQILEGEQMGPLKAGALIGLNADSRKQYEKFQLLPSSNYLILLNGTLSVAERYSTLCHELGHLFCGHVDSGQKDWWEGREVQENAAEVEAESVAFLVCRRQGLVLASESYLSAYRTPKDVNLPEFGFAAVLQATDYIEQMGRGRWKKPKKEGKERKYKLAR